MHTPCRKTCWHLLLWLCLLSSPMSFAAPFTATFVDQSSNQPLTSLKVVAKRIEADGSLKWAQRKTTDASGQAQFDLDFAEGQSYLFELRAFNKYTARLGDIRSAQDIQINVGNHVLNIVDGTHPDNLPLPSQRVRVERILEDGSSKQIANLNTDENGQLKLDLSEGRYQLKSKSRLSNRWSTSNVFSPTSSFQFAVGETPLTLALKHADTGAPIANQSIHARRTSNGENKSVGRKSTDENGVLVWELEGLSNGQQYQLSTNAFGTLTSTVDVNSAGSMDWRVGNIRVELQDGSQADNAVLAGHKVTLKRPQGDKLKTVKSMSTDATGRVVFDLADLDAEAGYILESRSPTDNKTKYTLALNSQGDHTFTVGSTPLTVTVRHAHTNAVMPNLQVTLREPKEGGGSKWVGRKTTDANGQFSADLPNLGKGQRIQLSAKVFNNSTSLSQWISEPGQVDWGLGKIHVQVIDGTQSASVALADHRIEFLSQSGDKLKVAKRVNSDASGSVYVDLPDIGETNPYLVRARSTVDGKTQYETWINQNGMHELVVGSKPVTISLTHARSGNALAGKRIWLRKWNDGEQAFKRVRSGKTDEAGRLSFDVADMDGKTPYQFEAKAISNFSVFSDAFTEAGDINLSAGKVQVALRDGSQASQPPLPNHSVQIRRYNPVEDKHHHVASVSANEQGILEVDLQEPPNGQHYVLRAKSLTDQKFKTSNSIGTSGDFEFIVGNPAVTVNVTEFTSGEPVSEVWVSAQSQDEGNEWRTVRRVRTDDMGSAVFDLDGITDQRAYRFSVKRYRGSVVSDEISAPGSVAMQVGALPVTLMEKDSNSPLANIRITAFEYANGELSYQTAGNTDAQGRIVFDLPELGESTYVLRANKPFPGVRRIHSPLVKGPGAFEFVVSPDDDSSIDTQAPTLFIHAPENDEVANKGFILSGVAQDDKQLERVVVSTWDSEGNVNEFEVETSDSGNWSGYIPGEWLTVDTTFNIAVTAFDRMENQTTVNRFLNVVEDSEAPELRILSHNNQEAVSQLGFSISGEASDNIQIQALSVNVSDSELGTLISNQAINIDAESGQWAIYLDSETLANTQDLTFSFSISDTSDNTAQAELNLIARAINPAVKQLVRRATFGATPDLEANIAEMGVEAWLEQQLNPQRIDDSLVESMVAEMPMEDLGDLRRRELIYQIFSERQLQQVMAWFWENHFSTNYNSHGRVDYEELENRLFRQHALGSFRELLDVSAKSPAMMIYLDNARSRAGRINENYSRELMELHTLGVDGGYSEEDVIALARILTGWGVSDGQFEFNSGRHDDENKFFLGEQVLAGGIEEGEATLDRLSRHPSTASFICGKLVHFWVNDEPQPSLQQSCAATFTATDGDIASLLRVIFSSDEFNQASNSASKVKTPLELYVSAMRATQAEPDYRDGLDIIGSLGMGLFTYPAPDGFGDKGADWINVDAMIQRTKFAMRLAFEQDGGEVDLVNQLQARGIETPEAVVDYLFNLLLSVTHDGIERDQALAILNQDSAFSFDARDAEVKLQRLLATVLAYPGFQHQ